MTSPYYQHQLSEFDESKHKRDSGGKFAVKEGRGEKAEKPAKAKQTDSPEFRKWFGDSKVVDDNGEPLAAYHGTDVDFQTFDPDKIGTTTDAGFLGRGFYFSTDPNVGRSNKATMQVYLRAEKPLDLQFESWGTNKETLVRKTLGLDADATAQDVTAALQAKGFDSVRLDYSPVNYNHSEIVVFDPAQIKSATGNRGTFDPDNPSITMAEGDPGDTVDPTANKIATPAARAARREVAHTSAAIAAGLKKKRWILPRSRPSCRTSSGNWPLSLQT